MEYLKIWVSFAEIIEPLNEAERGRLFTAMLDYARTGEAQELKGNERYVWPVAKQAIDRARAESEKLTANGSKGGRPRKAEETNENQEKPNKTNENLTKPYKEKDKDNNKDNTKREPPISPLFDRFWSEYPKKQGKQDALKAFAKLNPDEALLERMISAIRVWRQSAQWRENGGQYIPHPATWLNGKRWEDEAPKVVPLAKVSAQQYTQRSYTEAELEDRIESL